MKRIVMFTSRLLIALVLILIFTGNAEATNGYFSHGYGTQSKGLAGAGVAFPQNSLAAATNPAGMVHVGSRYDIGLAIFSPDRDYTITGNPSMITNTFGLTPGSHRSDRRSFIIPNLGANWEIDPISTIGVSIYGNGGMNTTWDTETFHGTKPTGVDLNQLFITATYSRRLGSNHSIGVTPIFSYQWFKATGLEAFGSFSDNAASLTNNGYDKSTGFGGRFGYLGEFAPWFSFGASYQTKIFMSEFDEYAGLFAEKGGFDIPSSWIIGVAVQPNPEFVVVADVQSIMYSGITSVSNPFNPADFQQGILLGQDDAAGFGWEDMTVMKFGVQYEGFTDLALRAGYSYGGQPIPESEMMFNILAPGVMEHHLTLGLTKTISEKEISFAVMHALSNSVSGPNPMEVPGQQTIGFEMSQWEFEVGFGF